MLSQKWLMSPSYTRSISHKTVYIRGVSRGGIWGFRSLNGIKKKKEEKGKGKKKRGKRGNERGKKGRDKSTGRIGCHSSRGTPEGLQGRKLQGRQIDSHGRGGCYSSTLLQGTKIKDSLGPRSTTSWIHPCICQLLFANLTIEFECIDQPQTKCTMGYAQIQLFHNFCPSNAVYTSVHHDLTSSLINSMVYSINCITCNELIGQLSLK